MRYRRRRRIPYRRYTVRQRQEPSISFLFAVAALLLLAYIGAATKAGTFLAENVVRPVFEQLGVFSNEEPQAEEMPSPAEAISYTVPAMDFYFLQAGVYASQDNAETEAQSIQKQGGAGYVYQDEEDFRVILSAYTSENDAEIVKQRLEDTMVLKILPVHIEQRAIQTETQEQSQALEQGIELLMETKEELLAANQTIETQQDSKQHLNTAEDKLQQAKSILEAQFSSGENQIGTELIQLVAQTMEDTQQAIQAQDNDLNTKAQMALCRFLGTYGTIMNQ